MPRAWPPLALILTICVAAPALAEACIDGIGGGLASTPPEMCYDVNASEPTRPVSVYECRGNDSHPFP